MLAHSFLYITLMCQFDSKLKLAYFSMHRVVSTANNQRLCLFLQVTTLYLVQVSGILSVWLLQFCNSMILGSLVLSFIVAALFIRHCQVSVWWTLRKQKRNEMATRRITLSMLESHRTKVQTTVVGCLQKRRWMVNLQWRADACAAVSFPGDNSYLHAGDTCYCWV